MRIFGILEVRYDINNIYIGDKLYGCIQFRGIINKYNSKIVQ